GPARLAPVDARGRRVGDLVAPARLELAAGVTQPHRDATEIRHGVLHRHLDALTHARRLPLPQRGHHAERRVDPGAGVTDRRARLERGRAREAGHAHGAAGGLRDHVERLVVGVGAVRPEALDREVDQARIELRERVVAEAVLLQRARGLILGDHVGLLDHLEEHGLAMRLPRVERYAVLVRVEQADVPAVDTWLLR